MRIWIHNFYHTHPQKCWLLSFIHSLLVVAFVFFFFFCCCCFVSFLFESFFVLSFFPLFLFCCYTGSPLIRQQVYVNAHRKLKLRIIWNANVKFYDFTFASLIETLNSLSPMHSLVILVCALQHYHTHYASTNFDLFKFSFF